MGRAVATAEGLEGPADRTHRTNRQRSEGSMTLIIAASIATALLPTLFCAMSRGRR